MTEIPEHLLKRSRDAKRALGLDVPAEDGAAPTEAPAQSANAPAVAGSSAPTAGAPVPIPAIEPPPPEPPKDEWVVLAENRKKIPYWVMPVLLFLPIWLIMYVGTLEDITREEGVLYEGGEVYADNCATCHGPAGGGGIGPAFTNGAVIETFSEFEDMVAWIVHGTQGYVDDGRATYGDTNKPLGGTNANMPAFGEPLEASEIMWATFYERINHGGLESELPFAEAVFEAYESGELELPGHFLEGPDGDFEDEIRALLAPIRAEMAEGEEVAAG